MANPLTTKLDRFARLSMQDRATLDSLASCGVRRVQPRHHLLHEGDRPTCIYLVVEGWAQSYKVVANGNRQLVNLLLPGDLCDQHFSRFRDVDYSVAAITPLTVAQISFRDFEALASKPIVRALRQDMVISAAIQRQWIMNIGQRAALERIAYFILELFHRLDLVGLTEGNACDFPLRQTEIADSLGLTPVHTNRMIQVLRREKLIDLHERRLFIQDHDRLQRVAMFNPNYLHLVREEFDLDAQH